MQQFVLIPASVYHNNNKSLNTQAATTQELPKNQAEQNPTYQIHSPRREINKKLFAKADSSVDKISSCVRIKLSNSQTLKLEGVETGVLVSPTLVLNQNATAMERGS